MDKACDVVVDLVSIAAMMLALALMMGSFQRDRITADLENTPAASSVRPFEKVRGRPCDRFGNVDFEACLSPRHQRPNSALLGLSPD